MPDRRDPELIGHSVQELLAQRIDALALGCKDLEHHALLRHDPLPAAAAGKATASEVAPKTGSNK